MPLIKNTLRKPKFGEKGLRSSKVKNSCLIECTCGKDMRGRKANLGYILEERLSTYAGGQYGTSRAHHVSTLSTVVCLMPGCLGRWRVRYDPKSKPHIKLLLWNEYVELKVKEGLPPPLTGVTRITLEKKAKERD
jgi:hypothetical protein